MTTEIVTLSPTKNTEPDPWPECASRWLEAVERRRGSARSRQEYQKSLTAFFVFLGGLHPAVVAGLDCQRWAEHMKVAGLAPATIKARLAAVSSFYQFACSKFEVTPGHYLHDFNPASVVQRPHVNPYEKSQGLPAEGVKALLSACDRTTVKGSRDYALIAFYVYTGRRCSEIARLTWADIRPGTDLSQYEYHYVGKGNKTRWRELPPRVWSAIEAYLRLAGRWPMTDPLTPLFVATLPDGTNGTAAIDDTTIRRLLNVAAKRAGLGHVKVHALRHTAAKLRRKTGATLEETSAFLDHTSLAITQVYLQQTEAKKDTGYQAVDDLLELD